MIKNKYLKRLTAGLLALLLLTGVPSTGSSYDHESSSAGLTRTAYAGTQGSSVQNESQEQESSGAEESKAQESTVQEEQTAQVGSGYKKSLTLNSSEESQEQESSGAEESKAQESTGAEETEAQESTGAEETEAQESTGAEESPAQKETEKPTSTVTKPKQPVLVDAYSQGHKIRLTWKRVKGADGYGIYLKDSSGKWKYWRRISSFEVKNGKITYVGGDFSVGIYRFSVRAYVNNKSKRVYGAYDQTGLKINITDWDLQTNYTSTAYRDRYGYPRYATIASGGCGAVAVGNIMRNLMGIKELTTEKVCSFATSCGARYNGGTDVETLLYYIQKKWGKFAYIYTEYDAVMTNCLKSGGMVVAHSSGYYPLVSDGGHFVVIKSVNNNRYTIFDSYYYEGKWTNNSIRRNYVTTTSEIGRIVVSFSQVHKAFNYYWLIMPATIQKQTQTITKIRNAKKGIRLTWKKCSSQATGYRIYRKTGSGEYTRIKTIYSGYTNTYLDQDVKKNKTYTYKIVAVNGSITSKSTEKAIRRKVKNTKKTN